MSESDELLRRVRSLVSVQPDLSLAVAVQDLDDYLRGVGIGLPRAWAQAGYMTDTSYQLLGILRHYAPTGSAQEACANLYREAQRDGNAGRELDKILAAALYDGLNAGNWPWVNVSDRVSAPPIGQPLRKTGAMPALVPCWHCDDGSDPDRRSPTGWCTRRDCEHCRESRKQTEDSTCGVCGGMNSVAVRP